MPTRTIYCNRWRPYCGRFLHRAPPRLVPLAWWLAHCFYPQAISQEEAAKEAPRFYRSCFGRSYGGGP